MKEVGCVVSSTLTLIPLRLSVSSLAFRRVACPQQQPSAASSQGGQPWHRSAGKPLVSVLTCPIPQDGYREGQLKLDRRFGGCGDLQWKREELSRQKGKGKAASADHVSSSFTPYYHAAHTHARTETEIDFPVGLTPNLRLFCVSSTPPDTPAFEHQLVRHQRLKRHFRAPSGSRAVNSYFFEPLPFPHSPSHPNTSPEHREGQYLTPEPLPFPHSPSHLSPLCPPK